MKIRLMHSDVEGPVVGGMNGRSHSCTKHPLRFDVTWSGYCWQVKTSKSRICLCSQTDRCGEVGSGGNNGPSRDSFDFLPTFSLAASTITATTLPQKLQHNSSKHFKARIFSFLVTSLSRSKLSTVFGSNNTCASTTRCTLGADESCQACRQVSLISHSE